MSDKKKDNALLAGGILGGLAVLAYLVTRSDKKSNGDAVKVSTEESGASAYTPDDNKPVGMPSPFRVIDNTTRTPGEFAVKYGGSFSRWKEIASANPDLFLVDTPSLCRDGTGPADGKPQCYATKEKRADGQPVFVYPFQTIAPWQLGQQVRLPAGWPG